MHAKSSKPEAVDACCMMHARHKRLRDLHSAHVCSQLIVSLLISNLGAQLHKGISHWVLTWWIQHKTLLRWEAESKVSRWLGPSCGSPQSECPICWNRTFTSSPPNYRVLRWAKIATWCWQIQNSNFSNVVDSRVRLVLHEADEASKQAAGGNGTFCHIDLPSPPCSLCDRLVYSTHPYSFL